MWIEIRSMSDLDRLQKERPGLARKVKQMFIEASFDSGDFETTLVTILTDPAAAECLVTSCQCKDELLRQQRKGMRSLVGHSQNS